jgi:hypothetical protein
MRRILVLMAVVAGCSHSSAPQTDPMLPELSAILDSKPANGYQVILPIVKDLQPGSDNELCTWTGLIVDHDIDIRAVESYQTNAGHHIVVFTTEKTQPAGTTRPCTDDDMATFRFSVASGAEGMGGKVEAPGNLVYHITAGSQVVLNHHYINATTAVRDAQSAENIWLADAGQTYVHAGASVVMNTDMHLPVGQATMDFSCTVPSEQNVWWLVPHMHALGTRITILQTSGGTSTTLFDIPDWSPGYAFHPPDLRKDPSAPLVWKAGDNISVHCEWNNNTGAPVTFGTEMCLTFASTVNANNAPNIQCDGGKWGTF